MWWHTTALLALLFQASPDLQQEAIKAIEAQRYTDAVTTLEKAIAAEPKSPHAHYYLGYAFSMLRRDDDAIAAYRKAIELQPDLNPARLNLGLVLMRQKRPEDAVTVLEPVVKAAPKQYAAVLALAEAMFLAGNAPGAEGHYRAALELNPKSAAAASGLGRALAKQGRLADADPFYRKAAELDPAHKEALLELAGLYEQGKQTKEAIALYENFTDNPIARERLGELLLEAGEAAAAVPHLESAVAASPTSANRYALAMAYITQKEYGKAEALFTEALKAEPGDVQLRVNYARVLREQKKYGPAAQEFFQVTKAKPESAEAWSDLAGMLILLENDQQALAALDKVRSLGGEKPAHHFFRAIVLDRNKAQQPALESYEKFLALSEGKNPDEEFKARQRVRILKKELSKK
jgi:Flp pilus assembly protein TadD